MPDNLLTTAQVAADLGVTPGRLRAIVRAGQAAPVRLGRSLVWSAADVAAVRPRIRGKAGAPPGNRNWAGARDEVASSQQLHPPTY
jgi:hypothetical protein